MSTLLKDRYSEEFIQLFCDVYSQISSTFNARTFTQEVFSDSWYSMELKQRMRHLSTVLSFYLPKSFEKACESIIQITELLTLKQVTHQSLEYMFLPDYIQQFGLTHFEISVQTFRKITHFTSCEFAVRPFLIQDTHRMLQEMIKWSKDPNEHVRRLSSEGSRPKLPWAMAVPELSRNPELVLPILENLKTDSSEYVRRSVANCLNDISKSHPQLFLTIAKNWQGLGQNTDKIIKHGARTLLKKANPEILTYFNISSENIFCHEFKIHNTKVAVGDSLYFEGVIFNQENTTKKIRIEYEILFLLNSGKYSSKVFKISERIILPNTSIKIVKKHSFKPITTRTYYPGIHALNFMVNGKRMLDKSIEFVLH